MSNRAKTREKLVSGKIGAVVKALKDAKVHLDSKMLNAIKKAISEAIDVGVHYQVIVTSEVKTVYGHLYLLNHKTYGEENSVYGLVQRGRVVFGDVTIGCSFKRDCASVNRKFFSKVFKSEINERKSQMLPDDYICDDSEHYFFVDRKVKFDETNPHVVFLETTDYGLRNPRPMRHEIFIYIPRIYVYGRVDAVLKKKKRFLPNEAIGALEAALDNAVTYKVEVIHDAERAHERLMLQSYEMTDNSPFLIEKCSEAGSVVYGEVKFGKKCYTLEYCDGGFKKSDRGSEREPEFDSTKPFVVIITNKRTKYRLDATYESYSYHIIIYALPTA